MSDQDLGHPADDQFQYGYSHESHLLADGAYAPISSDYHPREWFRTRGEALTAKQNDLRWRVPTFLIRRPKPASPERIGVGSLEQGE